MQKELNSKGTSVTELFHDISFLSVIEVFFYIIIVVILLKSFVLEFYRVESGSMEPELYKGDIVLVSRIAYFFGFPSRFPLIGTNFGADVRIDYREPKLGDIIVIDGNEAKNIPEEKFLIKRVVGIPGDTLQIGFNVDFENIFNLKKNSVNNYGLEIIIPKSGDKIKIDVNNLKYYLQLLTNEGEKGQALIDSIRNNIFYTKNFKFDNSYFFVQGDNTLKSLDSRSYGLIPDKAIIGRAVILLMSSSDQKGSNLKFL